jgi:hypothetical protein
VSHESYQLSKVVSMTSFSLKCLQVRLRTCYQGPTVNRHKRFSDIKWGESATRSLTISSTPCCACPPHAQCTPTLFTLIPCTLTTVCFKCELIATYHLLLMQPNRFFNGLTMVYHFDDYSQHLAKNTQNILVQHHQSWTKSADGPEREPSKPKDGGACLT